MYNLIAIWKYWHQQLGMSIIIRIALASALQNNYFCPQKLLLKNRIFMFFLALLVMASVSLCYNYFLYDVLKNRAFLGHFPKFSKHL